MSKAYRVRVQVIKVYDVLVYPGEYEDDNDARDEAISMVYDMQSTDIEADGDFVDVDVDYAEIFGSEEIEVGNATEVE